LKGKVTLLIARHDDTRAPPQELVRQLDVLLIHRDQRCLHACIVKVPVEGAIKSDLTCLLARTGTTLSLLRFAGGATQQNLRVHALLPKGD
jgi:hypothetical protein